jgi:hypothetical protein
MAEEIKLETLEEEVKLMKGELKQSLASVRDYLLNMELPASEFAAILAALGNDNQGIQKLQLDGDLSSLAGGEGDRMSEGAPDDLQDESDDDLVESPDEDEDLFDMEQPEEDAINAASEDSVNEAGDNILGEDSALEGEEGGLGEDAMMDGEDALMDEEDADRAQDTMLDDEDGIAEDAVMDGEDVDLPEDALYDEEETDDEDGVVPSESELPEEEEQTMGYERTASEVNRSVPRVNMLANLISWVSRAKREIGSENMATFLEVYGVSGHLTPELKDVILQLSEISDEQLEAATNAEIWSQSMLSLHGILTGGDAPLHPVAPALLNAENRAEPTDEEVIEVGKSSDKQAKLKLIFPNGDGESKEFCINFTPETENEGEAVKLEQ